MPALSDVELLCLIVAQQLLGIASERKWIRHAHPHARVIGELDRESAGDLLRGPPAAQRGEHPVHQPVMGASRVQPVTQVGTQVRMILLGLPRPTLQLATDRGPMHANPPSYLGVTDSVIVQSLNLNPVLNDQMSVMCSQGSGTRNLSSQVRQMVSRLLLRSAGWRVSP